MKWPLRFKTAFGIACIAFLLTAVAIALSYTVYVRTMDEHYAMLSQHVADTAALKMNGDKIRQYYDAFLALDPNAPDYNQKIQAIKDDDYHQMLNDLYGVRQANDVLYLYVEIFDFETMTDTYIMDADESGTACELGYTETLPEDMYVYAHTLNIRTHCGAGGRRQHDVQLAGALRNRHLCPDRLYGRHDHPQNLF